MRNALRLLLLIISGAGFAADLPLAHLGYPFAHTNVALAWAAPTNALPRSLWVYRAVRSGIQPRVLSYLISLGSFTPQDRQKVPAYPHIISYKDPSGKRTLWINPYWEYIYYRDQAADDLNLAEGVPDEQQTFQLATNLVLRLGINTACLARKSGTSDLETHPMEGTALLWRRPGETAYATNLCVRGVTFVRCLDGVAFLYHGSRARCIIHFGSHAKVSMIEADWRKLKRDKLYPLATPRQMMDWIRAGQAAWFPPNARPNEDWFSTHTLTITNVTPCYYAEAHGEFAKPNDWVVPFAALDATFEPGNTNAVIRIHCPILQNQPLR